MVRKKDKQRISKKQRPDKHRETEIPVDTFNRYFPLLLSSILLLALLLRLLALLSLKGSIYYDFLLWDERLYHAWASRIADGTFQSSAVYEMAPLPAYFMAFIYRLFTPDVIYVRIVNIILGVLTCYLIYLIGNEMANRKTGILACLLACLYKPFIFYNIVPLKTSLSVFLFALTCYLLVSLLDMNSIIKALLLGITLGLINNVRPNAVVLIPFFLLLIPWGLYKGKASLKIIAITLIACAGGLAMAQSPFIIRNYIAAGEASPTTSQSGFHLYMSNNLEYQKGIPFTTTSPDERGIQFTIEASRRAGRVLTPREASDYWARQTMEGVLKKPVAATRRFLKKILVFFNWFEKGDHYDIGFISDFVPFFKIPFLSIWMILPFGMAGMAVNRFRSKKSLALSVTFFVYGATLILFFTNIRMRIPVLVMLIPFASLGIVSFCSFIQKRQFREIRTYMIVCIAFFGIEFMPVLDTKDKTAFLNTHAIILKSRGLEESAVDYWEESSRLEKRYSAFANLSLAGRALREGDFQQAILYIEKISDQSYAAAQKYDLLGDIRILQGNMDEAVTAYDKALDINSGLRNTRLKLVKALWEIDKQRALEESDRLEYIQSFYNLYGTKRKNK